jgi:molybdopterin/thiamine biosynthesis adenylyltransferase
MSAPEALDRTLRLLGGDLFPALPLGDLGEELTKTTVMLVADRDNLSSAAGQSALVAAFVCLAELGFEIILQIPEVEIVGSQPPLAGRDLREELFDLGTDLITPARPVLAERGPLAAVAIGTTPMLGCVAPLIRIGGGAWSARVGVGGAAVPSFTGSVPFGAILAAAAGAAEVTRLFCARFAHGRGLAVAREFDLAGPRAVVIDLPALPLGPVTELGRLEIVSGGAITNSLLFALLRCHGARATARVYDDDIAAESNLNRYPLLRRAWLGEEKVEILASQGRRSGSGVVVEPVARRLDEELAEQISGADQVLVGVDHIPSRWVAQRHCRGQLCVAATSHFTALVSEHAPTLPCAGCLHPRDDPDGPALLPTISFVSMLAGTLQAYRALGHAVGREPAPPTLVAGFNLAAAAALSPIGLAPSPICPVCCEASLSARAA